MLVVTVTGSPHEGSLIARALCCQREELVQETFEILSYLKQTSISSNILLLFVTLL